MSTSGLEIPPEFQDQLTFRKNEDERTDTEILQSLSTYRPVTSEKNVWAFWHSGAASMPAWQQRNVIDWIRLLGPSWTVRVLDNVPGSPSNALQFLPEKSLPETFVRGTMDGTHRGQYAADMLRGACLYYYGGVFMDVGAILIRHLDRVCWDQLEDPNSPFEVAVPWMYGITVVNHFVASRKGNPFIKRWHDLFVHLWKDRTNREGLIEHPLIAFAREMTFEDSRASNFHWDFKVPPQTVFEYIAQIVCWMRICMLEDTGHGFSGANYWQKHVLLFDVLPEDWGGEATLGFLGSGRRMFELLSLRRDSDPDSEEYKQAYKLVWRLLTKSSMQKITRGPDLTSDEQLGALWDRTEGKDSEPGTFVELLRYGSVNFVQTRPEIAYVKAPEPPTTMKKGVLEP